MKKETKNGILSGMLLDMTEDQIQILLEQQEETKPSRLAKSKKRKPKNKMKRQDYN